MESIEETVKSLPHEPGVYLYHDLNDEVIYVGKAIDLAKRVKQYFQRDDAVGEKTKRLVADIRRIEIIPVTSEFDALLLEAKLIRAYMPKYNVIARDDKSPLYVAFTLSEELPHIEFIRKGQVQKSLAIRGNVVFGPFQSSHALRVLVRQLRSAVPYCIQKERTGKPCFYTHLGLCNPCPSYISRLAPGSSRKDLTRQYRNNIFQLKALFEGNTQKVRRLYEKEMRELAKQLRFEEAAMYRQRIRTLYNISQYRYDPAIFLERGADDIYEDELTELQAMLKQYFPNLHSLKRIECFDMSQLFGASAVGSMVVLKDGKPETSEYRRFRIQSKRTISDTGMMREVLTRRFKHTDWPTPQFILIDGGKPQLSVAHAVFTQLNVSIPYAGLAKQQEELILPYAGAYKTIRLPLSGKSIKVLQRIRDEAHRFAITYHRLLREKSVLTV